MTDQTPETSESARRQLARRLRELRHAAGLTGARLAAECGWTQSKVSKIENCRTLPQIADVEAWARATHATSDVQAELRALTERALTSVTDWRSELRGGRRPVQEQLRDLEASVSAIRVYQPLIVPGLLQTAEYARRVFTLGRRIDIDDIPEAVNARIQRQEILYDQSRRLIFLIGEPALRFRIGPPHVLAGQLDRIVSLLDLPHLEIGVIPWSVETTVLHYHGFVIFGEPDHDDDVQVHTETLTDILTIGQSDKVELYLAQFDKLRQAAVVQDEARSLILSIAAELRSS